MTPAGRARLDWQAFWPFYLAEHSDRRNRWMHFAGTNLAAVLLVATALTTIWWFLLAALLAGYAFAWFGHMVFERNRPATFTYPVKSFVSDWRLWALTWVGRAGREYDRHGVVRR